MSRRIFVGDVHGHYDGLMNLLQAIDPNAADEIYFVGDLIDRGPKSADVVKYVRAHNHACVLGNHEQLLIDAFSRDETRSGGQGLYAWLHSGGQATLISYNHDADLMMEHIEWFRSLPLYLNLGDIWLVHAGLDPNLEVHEQTAEECCWIRDVFHNGPTPYFEEKLIVTGHTITFTFPEVAPGQIVTGPGWLDIDTGAYHPKSGWLTALDIDNDQVYQYNVFEATSRVRSLQDAATSFTHGRRSSVAAR